MKKILDKGFMPMITVFRDFEADVKKDGGQKLAITIERNKGLVSRFDMEIYNDGTGHDDENFRLVERMTKALLWIHGGYKIVIGGSPVVGDRIKQAYTEKGLRAFDADFMSTVYEKPFEVQTVSYENAPMAYEKSEAVGRKLDGNCIGFDAGGSDRKVSAVINGDAVFSEEVVWHPKKNSDPSYHYQGILDAMKTAASHMPKVDKIGVSTAGVVIDNRMMVGSLFIKVSKEDFDKHVKNIYLDIAKELGGVPITVANDGDITALAGSMELNDGDVLGIAMGTSEAGGYVDKSGNITGRLNELAFVPVDFNEKAMADEWSGDYGCGVKYFSQDAVIKLAPMAGIELEESLSPAEKLKAVQVLMENGSDVAEKIYEAIGVYFAYAVAFYSLFYEIRHILILGRVTSGEGGAIILNNANEVLKTEFPELYSKIKLHLPDENSRRVGQSIAAASL